MADCVLYFSAEWCGPCVVMGRNVEWLADKFPSVEFRKYNVDSEATLVRDYQIRSVPTLVHLVDGLEVARVVGVKTREDLALQLRL